MINERDLSSLENFPRSISSDSLQSQVFLARKRCRLALEQLVFGLANLTNLMTVVQTVHFSLHTAVTNAASEVASACLLI